MKAFYQTSYKKSDNAKYGELPDPVIVGTQLLIAVRAVSINPVDYKIRNGDLKLLLGSKFPKIVGSDFSGIIKEVGAGVTGFNPGDRIYGAIPAFSGKPGSLAELVSIDFDKVRHIPEGMSFEEAASLPVAALTALNGLRRCEVKPGSEVLINGATGGVGHFAVQIAKAKGAVVTATCSEVNMELAKKLGADNTYRYKTEDIALISEKFDAILDAYGKMNYSDVSRLLKRGGIYASPLFFPNSFFSALWKRVVYGIKLTSSNMRSLPEDYEEIESLFISKKLKPFIENTFSLENAVNAFDLAENGKPRGKIIVVI
jgi:NADPH:quinone reductase-like Zn-dependent oxidoreductase